MMGGDGGFELNFRREVGNAIAGRYHVGGCGRGGSAEDFDEIGEFGGDVVG